jgi:hypothetical protein
MKIVNAVWEKRNLGVSCNEITIETSDTISNIQENILNLETEYTVVKVPTDKPEISLYLQEKDYIHMETVVNCVNKAELPKLNSIQQRIVSAVTYDEMNSNDLEILFSEVKNGMFETDRVSIDKYFTQEQSNTRYSGWINDELKFGSKIYKLVYKESAVGFFILKDKKDKTFVAVLGGIYKQYQSHGFGFCMNYYEIREVIKQKAKKIFNTFSTNNRGATSIHFTMNYNIDSIYNIYIKHKREK